MCSGGINTNTYPNLDTYLSNPDKEEYPQICVWLATVALTNEPKAWTVEQFEEAVEQMGYKVKYITEYQAKTPENAERTDLLFALHRTAINKMTADRLTKFGGEIKWFEDYRVNFSREIPTKVLQSIKDKW